MEQLVISDFGTYLGKRSERAWVKRSDGTEEEYPLFRLGEIVIAKQGVSISADLIADAVRRGIRISFLDFRGEPYAMLSSPFLTATAVTRRAQLGAYHSEKGVEFGRTMVRGKLRNQANLLKYSAKYLRAKDEEGYRAVSEVAREIGQSEKKAAQIQGRCVSEVREVLMGLEGNAGKRYWEGVAVLLRGYAFEGREHRGATDLVNSLLNYGYGILYSKVWGALLHAGLEPFCGFLHVDRPGKPSLVLDFIEEFRQPVVDRTIFALVNRGVNLKVEKGLLSPKTRRIVAEKVLDRLEGKASFEGKQYKLKSIIQMQARHLAMFFRGERPYRCYRFRW